MTTETNGIYLRTTMMCYPIEWIGVADFDGCLRFELKSGEDYMREAFEVFSDPEQTKTLTRIVAGFKREFTGFTKLKGFDVKDNGNLVVALRKEA